MKMTVLITGGTSGIGLAAAREFLQNGHRVALMARHKELGERAVDELRGQYPEAQIIFVQGDVSRLPDCQRSVAETAAWGGGLDVLVNSAGIYFERALEDVTEEKLDRMLGVNLKGTMLMTQQAVVEMKKHQSGCIINVSSDAGLHGNLLCSTYCATKGAVNMFTRAMALELGPYGIRINAVCPGDVLTPLTEQQLRQYPDRQQALQEMSSVYPMGRIAKAEEIASVIYFLSTEGAGFVNGALWSIDGGLTS